MKIKRHKHPLSPSGHLHLFSHSLWSMCDSFCFSLLVLTPKFRLMPEATQQFSVLKYFFLTSHLTLFMGCCFFFQQVTYKSKKPFLIFHDRLAEQQVRLINYKTILLFLLFIRIITSCCCFIHTTKNSLCIIFIATAVLSHSKCIPTCRNDPLKSVYLA